MRSLWHLNAICISYIGIMSIQCAQKRRFNVVAYHVPRCLYHLSWLIYWDSKFSKSWEIEKRKCSNYFFNIFFWICCVSTLDICYFFCIKSFVQLQYTRFNHFIPLFKKKTNLENLIGKVWPPSLLKIWKNIYNFFTWKCVFIPHPLDNFEILIMMASLRRLTKV